MGQNPKGDRAATNTTEMLMIAGTKPGGSFSKRETNFFYHYYFKLFSYP